MTKLLPKNILPYLALVVGVLGLAISPLFASWSQASGPVFAFYRMVTGSIVLLPFFLAHQRKTHEPLLWRLLIFPLLGGLANALDLSFVFTALHLTRLANATLLNNTAPLWVALVAWLFFREKLKGFFWVGLLLALVGAGIVLGTDFILHPSFNLGNMVALISSFFFAAYYLITQRGREHMSALQYTYLMTLSSGLMNLTFSRVLGLPMTGFPLNTYLASIASGVITQSIGFLALSYALGKLSASLVSPTMIFQPVLSAILAIPLLGQTLQPGQWIGGLAVVGGIYLVNRSQNADGAKPTEILPPQLEDSLGS